ncbi:hypothetical protein [Stieleria mannarensis]|uniref:hypothetical protein n=1 Tax=Stieleria mannarensis TaxID=2755585 RepID=UPI0015FF9D56|nr:hypothetical protein [Rhodopirellula sp. JC639]
MTVNALSDVKSILSTFLGNSESTSLTVGTKSSTDDGGRTTSVSKPAPAFINQSDGKLEVIKQHFMLGSTFFAEFGTRSELFF